MINKVNINGLLIIAIGISLSLIWESKDLAYQLNVYNFGEKHWYLSWKRDLFLNCGAGLIISVALIFLYDQVLRRQEQKGREQRCSMGAKSLLRDFEIYLLVYYGSLLGDAIPFTPDFNHEEMVLGFSSEEFLNKIKSIDLTSTSVDKNNSWLKFIVNGYTKLKENVDKVLITHEQYFDLQTIELLKIFSQSFFVFQINLMENQSSFSFDNEFIDEFEDHINECISIIARLKKIVK